MKDGEHSASKHHDEERRDSSDFEDAELCLESWTPPEKKREKNESKKNKKATNHKKERGQKKKKNPKFSETKEKMKEKRKKKKGKKKRKDKLELDCFTFTQVTGDQAKHLEKPPQSNPSQNETLNPDDQDQGSKKKTKKRKMVAFGLSPVDIRIKRPKFASLPKDMKAVTEGESCSQVSATEHNQTEPHDNHSQCTSDDINSQDLFITQKIFRASPVEPSSSEASDRPTAASPQVFKHRDKGRHTAEREIKHKHPQNSYSHQLCGASQKFVRELKTVGKAKEDKKIHEQPQLEKTSFQTPTKFKANLAEGKKASLSLRPKVVNPFMDEPLIINPTPVTSSSQCSSLFPPQINELSPLPPCKVSTSTQTENFFTSELSFYRSFCQKNRKPVHSEDLKPLDLSLPLRVRKDLCLSVNLSAIGIRDEEETLHDQKPSLLAGKMKDKRGVDVSGSPPIKDDEVKKDSSGQSKRTPSPQSDADLKSADTTTSSEDDHHYHCGRRDPIQVKGIQMKLNKPFFFKTKGEERSPRPESPLMKLSQDIQVKKRH